MPNPFHDHIRTSLDNPVLQDALDANALRRIKVRQEAMSSLSDPQALRKQARAVRAEVIANLDAYLDQFIEQARKNGMIVHRASNAVEAVQIVLNIASQNHARRIAKSKTMLGEEIHLNQALEKAGLEVVETDLGEFIVQIRGERPAHIITPAVHLRRQEVGQTFHEKLGMPLTEDIPTMTTAIHRLLREVFLKADIGISGVNFGVAETGTVCLLTNEGNGRMVTTVPPIHIALMGIERLVPTLENLALMLRLLPRSATGQKMTVYTSLIHGPRREGEVDGPHERHLILIDNGRSKIQRSPLAEALYCIRCGSCLNACPVFRELGGHAYVGIHGADATYPGPIGSVLSPALFGQSEFGNLARASSLCGACKEACPVDIDLPKLLLRVRAGGMRMDKKRSPKAVPFSLKLGLGIYTWIATHPVLFAIAQHLAGLGARLLPPWKPWLRLPALTGWGYSKDFPRPAVRPYLSQWKSRPKPDPQEVTPSATKPDASDIRFSDTKQSLQPPASSFAIPHSPFSSPLSPAPSSLLSQFENELTSLGGVFTCCENGDLTGSLLAFLRERDITSLLGWEAEYLPPGLLDALREAGIRVAHAPDPDISAGITGCLAGLAETGTLVLPGGRGRPLTASLLPEVHIALLKAEDLFPNLEGFLGDSSSRIQQIKDAPAAALISGPSRTADIEMTLTIGVHGPKEIQVFCY